MKLVPGIHQNLLNQPINQQPANQWTNQPNKSQPTNQPTPRVLELLDLAIIIICKLTSTLALHTLIFKHGRPINSAANLIIHVCLRNWISYLFVRFLKSTLWLSFIKFKQTAPAHMISSDFNLLFVYWINLPASVHVCRRYFSSKSPIIADIMKQTMEM